MFDKMKQLMEFKRQAEVIKKELAQAVLEVDSGKGIRIVVNGTQDFQQITITPERLTSQGKAALEQDLLEVINRAVKKSQEMATQKMSSVIPQF